MQYFTQYMISVDLDEYFVMRNGPMISNGLKHFVERTFTLTTVSVVERVQEKTISQGAVSLNTAFTNISTISNASFCLPTTFPLLHGSYAFEVVYDSREKTIARVFQFALHSQELFIFRSTSSGHCRHSSFPNTVQTIFNTTIAANRCVLFAPVRLAADIPRYTQCQCHVRKYK